ncbi:MAG: site-specific DNA-methyltransferase [Patescibacteria group bacterium]
MPSLNWIGKEKIVNHDKDVPFRLLRKNKKFSLGESENLILEGDNLEALKALMPFYYGKIRCIYIDPPYNTGNEKWVYNDKVNSPKIKEWLGKVVGPEGDDLTRHDKWLCMMYPRLKLLRELLSDDGVIFVSIDDNEYCNLKMAMDEIFGAENFITNFIRKSGVAARLDAKHISKEHDYILCYAKNEKMIQFNKINRQFDNSYNLEDEFVNRRGKFKLNKLDRGSIRYSESADFSIKAPDGTLVYPGGTKEKNGWSWRWSNDKINWGIKNGFIVFKKIKNNWSIYFKQYQYVNNNDEIIEREIPYKSLLLEHFNEIGNKEIKEIFGKKLFDYPKSVILIKDLIASTSCKDSIILDSFAGSGTTAHAVLDLNKEDGGRRKFILVEMEKNIAKNITAERVKRVVKGYSYKNSSGKIMKVEGLGGGFEYVELGPTLFDKDGMINKAVGFEDMARYVYFTETRTNLEKKNIKGNYLGNFAGAHYFLFFDGIGKNVLDRKFLSGLKPYAGKKIIYADKCLLDDEVLEKHQIIFKQIPYQVKVY